MKPPQYFSRFALTDVTQGGNLPHWSQWCATFVTFRLVDSLPVDKLEQMRSERDEWLRAHGVVAPLEGASHPQGGGFDSLTDSELAEYRELFSKRFHNWLDAGYGSCVMHDERVRNIVEETLRHFADIRYSLYAYVVKPNHVHVLFMPEEDFDSRDIVSGWKSFSAHAINRLLGRRGILWQKESYDHLIRGVEDFNSCRSYIRMNDPSLAFDAYAS